MRASIRVITGMVVAFALLTLAAEVQAATSDEIRGTVKDALGRPLSGASSYPEDARRKDRGHD